MLRRLGIKAIDRELSFIVIDLIPTSFKPVLAIVRMKEYSQYIGWIGVGFRVVLIELHPAKVDCCFVVNCSCIGLTLLRSFEVREHEVHAGEDLVQCTVRLVVAWCRLNMK